jgi:HPt (histidine-containing phosphotransfer) domain-containing protein
MMPPPLDWDRFQTLADGADGVRELARFFVPYVEERLAALATAIGAGLIPDVELVAHQLAGSSATAGAATMAAPLLVIEQMARDGGLADADVPLRAAEAAFVSIRAFLHAQTGPADGSNE